MRILFFIILSFACSVTHSQEKMMQASATEADFAQLSASELLKKAESLREIDPQISTKLANEALSVSENNNHPIVAAQAHVLLGNITYNNHDIDQSLEHFSQAIFIYQSINDKRNQILYSVNYIDILLDAKRYEKADKKADELLSIAVEYGDVFPIGLTIIAKADGYYQQKRYNDAIAKYQQALAYLIEDDNEVKNHLGETYKMIAQSYKRLKSREKTAYFYKKSLQVYTELDDKRIMARSLNALAEAERHLGNLVVALDHSLRSLEIHRQLDDPEGHAKSLVVAGIIYRHLGRYEESLNRIHEANVYYTNINDTYQIAETSNQLGMIYTRLKQFDQARSFYQLSIDLPEGKVKQMTLASALREMAVIHLNMGDYDAAMELAQKAHQIYQKHHNKLKATRTARVIANIYREQKDLKNSVIYYQESLKLAIELDSKIYQIKAQTALAGVLIGIDTDESIRLLKKSLALSQQINHKSEVLYAYRNLRRAEKSRKNIAASLRYAEKEINLIHIIQEEKDDKNLVLTKANLHSHKMEVELESLREKARLDQLELAKKNNEIVIAEKTRTITELELLKNKYFSLILALLLAICVLFVVLIYRRFIASKKRNRELDDLAARDPLTNSYNRRILFECMDEDFSQIEQLDEYCIIMVDIDHFKVVNDTHGHNAGDSVLRGVADILQACVRQHDVVSRFGGEEFCIVLRRVSLDQAMRIAETMRHKVESHRFDYIAVTCSLGVSSIEFNAQSPAELIDQADNALYKSKSFGRNQVTLWDKTFQNKTY